MRRVPIIGLQRALDDGGKLYIDFTNPQLRYHHVVLSRAKVRCFIFRVFSRYGQVIDEPKSIEVFRLSKTFNAKLVKEQWRLDITQFARSKGFPSEHIFEFIALNFVVEDGTKTQEVPLFPGESEQYIDPSVGNRVKQYLGFDELAVDEIIASYPQTNVLYSQEFSEIAKDLLEGVSRTFREDSEGAIKFFRKVIDGWKRILDKTKKDDSNRDRLEKAKRFSHSAYDLVSNFGEHTGSTGTKKDAKFARFIATGLTQYLTSYLNSETLATEIKDIEEWKSDVKSK